MERIETALKENGHSGYIIRVFANGAHGVLEVDAGNPMRPASPGRFIPGYLDYLVDWIKKPIMDLIEFGDSDPFLEIMNR